MSLSLPLSMQSNSCSSASFGCLGAKPREYQLSIASRTRKEKGGGKEKVRKKEKDEK